MTTVININFFRLNLNKFSVDDLRLNNESSDRRRNNSPPKDNVIDVTSQSRVLDDNESNMEHRFTKPRMVTRLIDPSLINTTYDRYGNIIQYFHTKGVLVDSYA